MGNANCYLPATSIKHLYVDVIKLQWHLKFIKQMIDLKGYPIKIVLQLHLVAFYFPNIAEHTYILFCGFVLFLLSGIAEYF